MCLLIDTMSVTVPGHLARVPFTAAHVSEKSPHAHALSTELIKAGTDELDALNLARDKTLKDFFSAIAGLTLRP